MKKKTCLALLLAFAIMTVGCSNRNDGSVSDGGASKELPITDTSQIFSDRDYEVGYDESGSAVIQLNGDSAVCSSDAVQISCSTVTITDEGTYILSGALDDGMIIVNTDKSDKVQLVLDNVTIHSKTCAPIYILQSDKVFITMAAGSANTLSNGGTFTTIDENNIDAVVFSKEDVTLNGHGTLVITSPAGHGIVSKDSLKITSGSYDINCASHAIFGKDDVCIANADFTIVSGKDGIHAENADDALLGYVYMQSGSFHISAEGDGISASAYLQIESGSYDITVGGGSENAAAHSSDFWGDFQGGGMHGGGMNDRGMYGGGRRDRGSTTMPDNAADADSISSATKQSGTADDASDGTSMKGMKAAGDLAVNGGEFVIDSADDAFHSNGSVAVNGGDFEIASGDDAFHADETLTVTAGTINIKSSYEGLEGAQVNISGGNITLTSSDDGLNAAGGTDSSGSTGGRDGMFEEAGMSSSSNGSITISGGTLKITASGDGIDSNGTLDITGGNITVSGPTQGDTAILDYDASGTISGGTFIGTGASNGMAQTISGSAQGVISVRAGNQSAGTQIQLSDSEGNMIIKYTPELDFALVIFSSPDIISGKTYTLTVGTSSGEVTAN